MKINTSVRHESVKTHEGGQAQRATAEKELLRTLSTCLLFENTFYESGDEIAKRLVEQAKNVSPQFLANATVMAKEKLFLRHAPLWMAVQLTSLHSGSFVIGNVIDKVVRRADELAEIVALYWKRNGKDAPLTNQLKRGLAKAFNKFDQYQFAKWDRDGEIKLRDVMFLVHPKPTREREALYRMIAEETLPPADTWEVGLSAAVGDEEKKVVWERLLSENRLGALALVRNLRNMEKVGVTRTKVIEAMTKAKVAGILPYQLVSAWKAEPAYAGAVDLMAQRALETANKLSGTTVLVVDVSGSMNTVMSSKSTASRIDAAGALAAHVVGVCDDVRIFTFSNNAVEVPRISGFGLIKAISQSQEHGGTHLDRALDAISKKGVLKGVNRIIVITDEQVHGGGIPKTEAANQYLINVAPYKYGVAAEKSWTKIDGFSPAAVDWIIQEENDPLFKE